MKINNYIYLPILCAFFGLFLILMQVKFGFVEFKAIYVFPFILFGLVLALVRESSISEKYQYWLQVALWISVLVFIIGFMSWDSIFFSSDEYSQPQSDTVSYQYSDSKFNVYELEYVVFQYPSDFEIKVDSVGVVKLLSAEKVPWGTENRSERMYLISESETEISDFQTYAEQYANSVHDNAVDFGSQESPVVTGEGSDQTWSLGPVYGFPHYEVYTDVYNRIPVIVEKSNSGSMCGNVYNVTFWLGGGKLVNFSTDCFGEYPYRPDSEIIKSITYSFQLK